MFVLQVSANAVKGKVNGTQIQCIFEATVSQTTKATSRTIGLVTGTYNGCKFICPTRDIRMCVFSQILD